MAFLSQKAHRDCVGRGLAEGRRPELIGSHYQLQARGYDLGKLVHRVAELFEIEPIILPQ